MDPRSECPKLGEWVERHDETCRGGRRMSLLVNRRDGQAIQLSDTEIERLNRIDGTHSRAELSADGTGCEMLTTLADDGFLQTTSDGVPVPPTPPRRVRRFFDTLSVEWRHADRFVQWAYRRGLRHAFRPDAVAAQLVLAAAGLMALVAAIGSGRHLQLRPGAGQIPLVLTTGLVAVAVHELAHALVVAHNGRRVHSIGFRLHMGTPAFYVDAIDALLLPRRQRLIQAAAGPWAEWLVTSIIAVALWCSPFTWLTPLLYRFVILNTLTIASNLLPFVGLDGHWLLADGIGEPDLARRCHGSVGRLATDLSARRHIARYDVALAGYAILNTLVAGALVVTAAFFWWELFGNLIGHLAHGGPTGWAILTAAAILLGRPLVIALTPRVTLAMNTVGRLAERGRFRTQHAWRIAATEQLALEPAFTGLDDRTLSIIAGRLYGGRTIRRTARIDPNFSGYAITGPPRRPARSTLTTVTAIDHSHDNRIRCTRGGFVALLDHSSLTTALITTLAGT